MKASSMWSLGAYDEVGGQGTAIRHRVPAVSAGDGMAGLVAREAAVRRYWVADDGGWSAGGLTCRRALRYANTQSRLNPGRPYTVARGRRGGAEAFLGDIAEIIKYDTVLSAGNRASVTTYLGTKYGITVS